MRRFTRDDMPVALPALEQRAQDWEHFVAMQEHTALGDALYERQQHYCAYCETLLHAKKQGFIEHLERRRDNPARSFDWNNMFYSCKNGDSCGKFKDAQRHPVHFAPADIVDPSREDPQDFFTYDANGTIRLLLPVPKDNALTMSDVKSPKKLIEMALPMSDINAATIRNSHSSHSSQRGVKSGKNCNF